MECRRHIIIQFILLASTGVPARRVDTNSRFVHVHVRLDTAIIDGIAVLSQVLGNPHLGATALAILYAFFAVTVLA